MTHNRHHSLQIKDGRNDVEVWDDDGDPAITLLVANNYDRSYVDLLPAEARALAALLVAIADRREGAQT